MPDMPHEFSPELRVAQETLQPFDVREREGLNPMIKLAMVAGGLLLVALIVLKLYTPGVRDRADPPRITADNTPFKVKPADAGGAQTPNQDKIVFEVMDGKSPTTDARPNAVPEQPIRMEAPIPITRPVRTPEAAPVRKSNAARSTPAPTVRPVRPAASASAVASRGSEWVVQVASTRSEADAAAIWTALKKKHPGLVSGTYADVKRADLGDKGIYYRTRIAGLADKSSAQSLCSSFKSAGQACFVAKR